MPDLCVVTGSFSRNNRPIQGWVQFTPSRLWVVENGIYWACLAPTKKLDYDGSFTALLTPTDTDAVPWHYEVATPAGFFHVRIPKDGTMYTLKDLVDHPPQP